jgi:hypothetical protein
VDAWPSECVRLELWRSFVGRSHLPIVRLLTRGSLPKKVKYLIGHLSRIADADFAALEKDIGIVVQARNRVLHMAYLLAPGKASALLDARQAVHLAKLASETAQEYIDLLADVFEEIHLPIRTIRRWENEPFLGRGLHRYDAPDAGLTTASIESVAPGASARRVVLRCLTEVKSTVFFESIKDVESVHGHEGKTKIVFE